ncbi:hypothetical protein IEO21_06219 [Rhodonia placenta]|uniref:Uncharacterized protein n=1 Tax=Rhodonia placenta TaxID=104341 RepID=A0A8H7P0W0_9APHY|nr:hypothetical protein IEO21_06219 [Postia placenta]
MTSTATSYVGTVHGMMKITDRVALQRPHIVLTSWKRATMCDYASMVVGADIGKGFERIHI